MSENRCRNCRYYIQHYAFAQGKHFEVNCGHCTFMRLKYKKASAKACEAFAAGARTVEFVTKEYMRKELLQYMLSLELFPEQNGKN